MSVKMKWALQSAIAASNKRIEEMRNRTMAGLVAAGIEVEANATKGAPHKYGNLRGSSYTRMDPGGKEMVEVGFQASYAPYVHELGPREGGVGRKWFLALALQEVPVKDIIRRHARVPRGGR